MLWVGWRAALPTTKRPPCTLHAAHENTAPSCFSSSPRPGPAAHFSPPHVLPLDCSFATIFIRQEGFTREQPLSAACIAAHNTSPRAVEDGKIPWRATSARPYPRPPRRAFSAIKSLLRAGQPYTENKKGRRGRGAAAFKGSEFFIRVGR